MAEGNTGLDVAATPRSVEECPVTVLVDAYSTGAMLAREAARSHRLVHVRTRSDMPAAFAASVPRDVFETEFDCPGDIDELVSLLARYSPVAVISASEFGVEVADAIAARLGLRGNDPALSAARRDKARMMAALRDAGLRTPRERCATTVDDLLAWRRGGGFDRVVVKPVDSAGSEDVYVCASDAEVSAAFDAVYGKRNLMMRTNRAVLIQEYLDGAEYVVNSVSRDGTHWFTDAWGCVKAFQGPQRKVYDYEELLAPTDPALARVLPYVAAALDALGIANGPAHTELILTADGPCLLELGARVSGLANPAALDRCTGANQVSLTLDCHSQDATALRARPLLYPRRRLARCVNLIARRELAMPAGRLRAELAALPAVESVRFRVADGARTRRTVDLNSSPGAVFLVHSDAAELEAAHARLRELERELL